MSAGAGNVHSRHSDMRPFEEVAALLRGRAEELCQKLLPHGRRSGHEWIAGDIGGGRGRSLSVNLREGVWKDFSTGEGGADLINLIAVARRISNGEAKRWAEEDFLGLPILYSAPSRKKRPDVEIKDDAQAGFEQDVELSDSDDYQWYRYLLPTNVWDYISIDGELVAQVYRFKHPADGRKAVRPWNPKTNRWEAPSRKREGRPPLYLRDLLEAAASQPIVICEGEKAADAVRAIGWLATTCMGGAQAVRMTDWSALAGRHIIIWRDKDEGGRHHQEVLVSLLRQAGVASCRAVNLPLDKPVGWDAADAEPEERQALLNTAQTSEPVSVTGPEQRAQGASPSALPFDIHQWSLRTAFQGDAPQEQWLIENSIPLGEPGLLVAMGDTGKGMLGLELALRVADGRMNFNDGPILGGHVRTFGNVVIVTAEDSSAAVHRRLRKIDPDGTRQRGLLHEMVVVPLPNAGGAFPLIAQRGQEIVLTDQFEDLRKQLCTLRPKLVIFDPLQSFCQADINADPAAGSMIGSALSQLGVEINGTILVPHHMRKPQGKDPPETAMDAREMIRGTTALVDGVRFVYIIWPEHDGKKARAACERVGRSNDGHSVYRGGIAKANGASSREMHTLVRDPVSGLLRQLESLIPERRDAKDIRDALLQVIAGAAQDGQPFSGSVGAEAGLYTRRASLPAPLCDLSKGRLSEEVEHLEREGRIVRALYGSTTAKWLDVPSGPFAMGAGFFARGARMGKPGRRASQPTTSMANNL